MRAPRQNYLWGADLEGACAQHVALKLEGQEVSGLATSTDWGLGVLERRPVIGKIESAYVRPILNIDEGPMQLVSAPVCLSISQDEVPASVPPPCWICPSCTTP